MRSGGCDPAQRAGRSNVLQSGSHYPQGIAALLDQAASECAGLVAHILNHILNSLRVAGETSGRLLITRLTVCVETPNAAATSLIVRRPDLGKIIIAAFGIALVIDLVIVPVTDNINIA